MGAIAAGRQAVGAVVRNPILIVVTLLLGIIQVPQLLVQVVNSTAVVIASGILSLVFLFLYPFFYGGIVGMGDEAIEGKTRLGTFVSAGRTHYASLFGAFLILLVIGIVYAVVLGIISVVGGIAVFSLGNEAGSGALLGVVGLVLVVVLASILLFFSIQFFGQAIVLDGVGAVEGYKRSIGAVRRHKLSTLGYTVVIGLVGGFFGALGAALSLFGAAGVGGSPTLSTGGALVALAVFVVFSGVIGAFTMTYGVSFYRQIRIPAE